jgi:hypothetical protein
VGVGVRVGVGLGVGEGLGLGVGLPARLQRAAMHRPVVPVDQPQPEACHLGSALLPLTWLGVGVGVGSGFGFGFG